MPANEKGDFIDIAADTLKKDWAALCSRLPSPSRSGRCAACEELWWFTQKFDHKNHDKPWGESKDALARAIQKLSGNTSQK